METMEQQRHSLSSLPMLTRLDHLDFVIKNLEIQQNLPKWKEDQTSSATRGVIDRGTAIREAYFKGSLLDRISALETRLLQICLELESSSGSSTSTGETSSQKVKKELTKTLPVFSSNVNPFHMPLHHPQEPREMEEKIEEEKEEEVVNVEKPLLKKKKTKKKKKNDGNETCKLKEKKTKSPKKCSRFSLLGC